MLLLLCETVIFYSLGNLINIISKDDIEFLCECISSHMGRFNTSDYSDVILPIPKTPEQKFVHMCDYLASRKVINVEFDKDNNIVDE